MLTYETSEQEETRLRGLQASTFVAQPFWQELQKQMYQMIQEQHRELESKKFASPDIRLRMLDYYLLAKDIVARIERIPQAAIEAAREPGEE